MKKKIILNILIIVVLFAVTGCGKDKNLKAIIIDNEGTTTELTYNEFNELTKNEAKFANLYDGATIELIGIIKSIQIGKSCIDQSGSCSRVILEDGWAISLLEKEEPFDYYGQKYITTGHDLSSFDIGDKIKLKSKIIYSKQRYDYNEFHLQSIQQNELQKITTRVDETSFEKV